MKISNLDFIKENELLSNYTYLKIGGPALYYAEPTEYSQIIQIQSWCRHNNIPIYYLGNGSNLLVNDKGVNGFIISFKKFNQYGIERYNNKYYIKKGEDILIFAEAGVQTQILVLWCAIKGFSGLEFLAGIPGTIGGNIITNAGVRNKSIGNCVEYISTISGTCENIEEIRIKKKELDFQYRKSNLANIPIYKAVFKLSNSSSDKVRKTNERYFKKRINQPRGLSLGCTFKNPIGYSAGELIENAGLKGLERGGAYISNQHANFIINKGNATYTDIIYLIEKCQIEVIRQFGISLELEIHII